MAKVEFDMGDFVEQLEALGSRENIRRIVEAGSREAIRIDQERTEAYRHVVTRKLKDAISAGPIHEDLGKAWQYVYPQGTDERGQSLYMIGYVIDQGRGKRKTKKTGDKFLTGHKKELEDAVGAAMKAEAERILQEIMR